MSVQSISTPVLHRRVKNRFAHPAFRFRLATALVNIFLFSYSSITQATLTLLRCVRISGFESSSLYLFGDASIECFVSGWQNALFLLVAIVVVVPFYLIWWVHRVRYMDLSGKPTSNILLLVSSLVLVGFLS
jgi:hypothetical protein